MMGPQFCTRRPSERSGIDAVCPERSAQREITGKCLHRMPLVPPSAASLHTVWCHTHAAVKEELNPFFLCFFPAGEGV